MFHSLYDILHGFYFDNSVVYPDADVENSRLLSVMSNLQRLFNSRQGSVEHLPDYGLPDTSFIYRDMPYSIVWLQKMIEDAVKRYEPRLTHVRVRQEKGSDDEHRLVFLLSCKLDKETVRFKTIFAPDNLVGVEQVKRRDIFG